MKVRTVNLRLLITGLALPLLVGIVGGAVVSMGMDAFRMLKNPPLVPPGWVFVIVWTVLYILMGISAYLVRTTRSYDIKSAMQVYYIQLALNFLWVLTFFRFGWLWFSVLVLAALIAAVVMTVTNFGRINATAGRLLIPYLVWCVFALYLNIGYAVLN